VISWPKAGQGRDLDALLIFAWSIIGKNPAVQAAPVFFRPLIRGSKPESATRILIGGWESVHYGQFYPGKSTIERKDHIMDGLVVSVEEWAGASRLPPFEEN
jgi:hypothetical protein